MRRLAQKSNNDIDLNIVTYVVVVGECQSLTDKLYEIKDISQLRW